MGTLHEQPVRADSRISMGRFLDDVKTMAATHGMSVETVIAAIHAAELRRANDLAKWDGDAWDEQISGIGHCLDGIAAALRDLRSAK